jgi:hypothetical protein
VSRLWPEKKTLRLEAEPAELDSAEPWRGALERLKTRPWPQRADVTVILSNHFVRYAVVPQQDAASPDEELALARFHFARIHGERAKGWEVRLSGELACAMDTALLAGLKEIFSNQKGVRLVSVQPHLMAAYNRARRRIPRGGAWLLLAEPQRVCLARLAARGWAWVYNGRDTEWQQLIERERSRAGGESLPSLVLALA